MKAQHRTRLVSKMGKVSHAIYRFIIGHDDTFKKQTVGPHKSLESGLSLEGRQRCEDVTDKTCGRWQGQEGTTVFHH